MASFTDEIMQYTPYVQQAPVDDYVRVGMEKQQEYKQGVKTVQGYIDSLNGLDIAHPEQQAYMQQKMQQLKSRVTGVVSADYSKEQLINNIGSLASSIAKDPIVQNAIISTARYKNGLSEMQKAKADGKSNPANEWDFQNQAQSWLSNKDVKSSFTGEYTPFTDVRKKSLDLIKDYIKPDAMTMENPFTTDKDGKIAIDDALIKDEYKGISPQKIQSALYAGLNPQDFKQLEIEGKYSYSNLSPKELGTVAENRINTELTSLQNNRKTLLEKKSGIPIPQQNEIDKRLSELDDYEKSIKKEGDSYRNLINKNPEALKSQLYTNDFLRGIGNAFSYSDYTKEYKDNPYAKMQMEREKLNQDWEKFKLDYGLKTQEYSLKLRELELKYPNGGSGLYGGVTLPVPTDQLKNITIDKFIANTDDLQKQLQIDEGAFLKTQGKNKAWLDTQEQLFHSGKQISPLVENYFRSKETKLTPIIQNQQLIKDLNDEADKNPDLDIKNLIPKNAPNITAHTPIGDFKYTPDDLVNFNKKVSDLIKYSPTPITSSGSGGKGTATFDDDVTNFISIITSSGSGGKGTATFDDDAANKNLSPKEKILYNTYKKYSNGYPLTQGEQSLIDNLTNYNKLINSKSGDVFANRQAFLNAKLAQRTGETQRTAYTLDAGKPELKYQVKSMVDQLLAGATDMNKSLGTDTNTTYKDLKDITSGKDDKDVTYSLVVKDKTKFGDSKYWVRVSNSSDKNQYGDIPITPEQKRQIFGGAFEDKNSEFRRIKDQILLTGKSSTNFSTGNEDLAPSTAFLNKNDFSQVGNFSVKGDVIQQNGGYALRLYITDPTNGKIKTIDYAPSASLMSEENVLTSIKQLNDGSVYQLLYGKSPNTTDLEKINLLNQKPF